MSYGKLRSKYNVVGKIRQILNFDRCEIKTNIHCLKIDLFEWLIFKGCYKSQYIDIDVYQLHMVDVVIPHNVVEIN